MLMDCPTTPGESPSALGWALKPLLDGVVKESEGDGDLSSCAVKKMGDELGVGMEWNSSTGCSFRL